MDDQDQITLAKEELKRVDHLIHVSLKYTRTVDVFRSIIDRMNQAIDYTIVAYLEKLEEDGIIEEIPVQPGIKVALIKKHCEDEQFHELANMMLNFRKIMRMPYDASTEFRRHVTMTVNIDGEKIEITIDSITEDYKKIRALINHVETLLQ